MRTTPARPAALDALHTHLATVQPYIVMGQYQQPVALRSNGDRVPGIASDALLEPGQVGAAAHGPISRLARRCAGSSPPQRRPAPCWACPPWRPTATRFSHNGASPLHRGEHGQDRDHDRAVPPGGCRAAVAGGGLPAAPGGQGIGSGVVGQLHDGIEFTLGDLAFLMMSISDNSATNILIDQVGQDRVNATMQGLGHGRVDARPPDARQPCRPRRAGELGRAGRLHARHRRLASTVSAASAGSCAGKCSRLLEAQQNERRIARHLPRTNRPRWGSKTGSLPGVANDVGFVMTAGGPVIMAVFCENPPDPNEGERIIGDVARVLLGTR